MEILELKQALDVFYAVAREATEKKMLDWPESEEFYNLMQAYRHAPMENQQAVVEAYKAVKEYLRGLH
jgi:predicted nucleotide-binding protein (sugar kinase/HSP70/actin superfamily)